MINNIVYYFEKIFFNFVLISHAKYILELFCLGKSGTAKFILFYRMQLKCFVVEKNGYFI